MGVMWFCKGYKNDLFMNNFLITVSHKPLDTNKYVIIFKD